MSADHSSPPLELISSALRRERDRTGMTLSELAKRAGVAKSTLSHLESGQGNPSIETLWALAVALGVPFGTLVEPEEPQVRIIRSGEAPLVRADESAFTAALLSSCPSGARRDLYVIDLEPDAPRHAAAHLTGTVEHLYVVRGGLRTGPQNAPVELSEGDYLAFSGATEHRYEALAEGTRAVLVMEHR